MDFSNPNINHNIAVNTLKIHALNTNSIVSKSKRHYVAYHLNAHKPDFLLLSETCLRTAHKLDFSNYNFIRTDKINNTRGTGILLKKMFKFKQISIPNMGSIEYTAISLKDFLAEI